eukprot:1194106-Prorocentrum_minimum.AAC.4
MFTYLWKTRSHPRRRTYCRSAELLKGGCAKVTHRTSSAPPPPAATPRKPSSSRFRFYHQRIQISPRFLTDDACPWIPPPAAPPRTQGRSDWLPHQEYALFHPVIGSHIKNMLSSPL